MLSLPIASYEYLTQTRNTLCEFLATRITKNVPWHILAPAAVACDIYLIRRSVHPRRAFFTLQESNFL